MIWFSIFFLAITLFIAAVCSVGVLMGHDSFDRLHFLGPITIVGSLALFFAVLFYEGFSQMSGKTAVAVIIIIITGPVVTHAIARAGYIRGDAERLRNETWKIDE